VYRQTGLGVFNMANDPTCGLFQFGIFQPRCWAEAQNGPIVPGQSTNVSDSSFTLPPAPVALPIPDDLTGQTTDIDAQIAAQHAQNNTALAQWAAQQQAASKASDPNRPEDSSGLQPWMILAGVGVAVFAVVALGGRR